MHDQRKLDIVKVKLHSKLVDMTRCLFQWKTLYKNSFLCFPVFGGVKKTSQRKTIFIFSQHRKYDLFLEIIFH